MTEHGQLDTERPTCTCCGAPVCRCIASVPPELRYCRACRALGLHRTGTGQRVRPWAQTGILQTCAFCGAMYHMREGEMYRPASVCAACWPVVSDIEAANRGNDSA